MHLTNYHLCLNSTIFDCFIDFTHIFNRHRLGSPTKSSNSYSHYVILFKFNQNSTELLFFLLLFLISNHFQLIVWDANEFLNFQSMRYVKLVKNIHWAVVFFLRISSSSIFSFSNDFSVCFFLLHEYFK